MRVLLFILLTINFSCKKFIKNHDLELTYIDKKFFGKTKNGQDVFQFEMKNRFYSILKYINKTNDLFIKKVVNDIKKNEKYKIEIIKSFMYKVRNRI